jgi:hypothetical protein
VRIVMQAKKIFLIEKMQAFSLHFLFYCYVDIPFRLTKSKETPHVSRLTFIFSSSLLVLVQTAHIYVASLKIDPHKDHKDGQWLSFLFLASLR